MMVVESMTDFQKRIYALSSEINRRVQERSEEMREKELPEPMTLKVAQKKPPITKVKLDTGIDWPTEVSSMKSMIKERDYSDTVMASVEDLRGAGVTITRMMKGHREDGRDVILRGVVKKGKVSTQIEDLRLLFSSEPGVKNEVGASRILSELGLSHYPEQGIVYMHEAKKAA